jgi:hypothetical protein
MRPKGAPAAARVAKRGGVPAPCSARARGRRACAPVRLAALALALALAAGAPCPAAAQAPAQRIFDTSVFPDARPPLWPFRKMGDAAVACSVSGAGVVRLSVKHARFNGVKPQMMLWLMNNLQSGASVGHGAGRGVGARAAGGAGGGGGGPRLPSQHPTPPNPHGAPQTHPVNGVKYPNFLLFHPRFGWEGSPRARGAGGLGAALLRGRRRRRRQEAAAAPAARRAPTRRHPPTAGTTSQCRRRATRWPPASPTCVSWGRGGRRGVDRTWRARVAPPPPPRRAAPPPTPTPTRTPVTTWVEFPLTGCEENPGSDAERWTCNAGAGGPNPGVTKATPPGVWQALSQTNGAPVGVGGCGGERAGAGEGGEGGAARDRGRRRGGARRGRPQAGGGGGGRRPLLRLLPPSGARCRAPRPSRGALCPLRTPPPPPAPRPPPPSYRAPHSLAPRPFNSPPPPALRAPRARCRRAPRAGTSILTSFGSSGFSFGIRGCNEQGVSRADPRRVGRGQPATHARLHGLAPSISDRGWPASRLHFVHERWQGSGRRPEGASPRQRGSVPDWAAHGATRVAQAAAPPPQWGAGARGAKPPRPGAGQVPGSGVCLRMGSMPQGARQQGGALSPPQASGRQLWCKGGGVWEAGAKGKRACNRCGRRTRGSAAPAEPVGAAPTRAPGRRRGGARARRGGPDRGSAAGS